MKVLFTLLFFGLSITSYSQNLSLEELISLRKNDIANVEEYLSAKGWVLFSSEEGEDGSLDKVNFAYNKNEYSDSAESFLNYYYSDLTGVTRINLQIFNTIKYNPLLAKIKSYGCKLIDSTISDGKIKKTYQGATTTFMISIATRKEEYSESTDTYYTLSVLENSDYELNFSESE